MAEEMDAEEVSVEQALIAATNGFDRLHGELLALAALLAAVTEMVRADLARLAA